jgi:hypothetical protein
MKLSELPAMLIDRVEHGPNGLRIHGRFDRLDGVREGGCFRLARGDYVWANLEIRDRHSGTVTITDERDPDIARLRVGERYIWLRDYWQAPFVEAIADESTAWRRFTFQPSDAQYFIEGGYVGWHKVGSPLREGAIATEVRPGGWDHEHCDLCDKHIDVENPVAFTDDQGHFLCSECYERYGVSHDVSFQLGA